MTEKKPAHPRSRFSCLLLTAEQIVWLEAWKTAFSRSGVCSEAQAAAVACLSSFRQTFGGEQ